jgi:hypothetical protein
VVVVVVIVVVVVVAAAAAPARRKASLASFDVMLLLLLSLLLLLLSVRFVTKEEKNKRKKNRKNSPPNPTPRWLLERLAKRTFRELARARIDDRIRSASTASFNETRVVGSVVGWHFARSGTEAFSVKEEAERRRKRKRVFHQRALAILGPRKRAVPLDSREGNVSDFVRRRGAVRGDSRRRRRWGFEQSGGFLFVSE